MPRHTQTPTNTTRYQTLNHYDTIKQLRTLYAVLRRTDTIISEKYETLYIRYRGDTSCIATRRLLAMHRFIDTCRGESLPIEGSGSAGTHGAMPSISTDWFGHNCAARRCTNSANRWDSPRAQTGSVISNHVGSVGVTIHHNFMKKNNVHLIKSTAKTTWRALDWDTFWAR